MRKQGNKMKHLILLLAAFSFGLPAFGQDAELGAGFGGSFYTSREVKNGTNSVSAGFKPGFGYAVWAGQNMYRHIGGEIRYTFLSQDAKLSGLNQEATFGSQSHRVGYTLLFHATSKGSRVRPFFGVGGGVTVFRGTGQERVSQALSRYALLTRTNELKPYVDLTVGVKLQLSDRFGLRAEVRDYIGPVSNKLFTPNVGSSLTGWQHDFVPMVGIAYLF